MALVKAVAGGAATSLFIANVAHQEGSGDGGALGIVDFTALDHGVAWSWTIFAIATVVIWALFKALDQAGGR